MASGLLIMCIGVCAAFSSTSAYGNMDSQRKYGKALEPLREHATDLISMVLLKQPNIGDPTLLGCNCTQNFSCGCCATFYNSVGCVNMTYDPTTVSVDVVLTYNNKTLYNESISATNPPPFCTGLPYKFASWCTVFSNMSVGRNHFSGCLNYQLWILRRKVLEFPVGCFSWPPPSRVVAVEVSSEGCDCTLEGKCQCCSLVRIATHDITERSCVKLLSTGNLTAAYFSHANQLVDKAIIEGSADSRLCLGSFCAVVHGMVKSSSTLSGCIQYELEMFGRKLVQAPGDCFQMRVNM